MSGHNIGLDSIIKIIKHLKECSLFKRKFKCPNCSTKLNENNMSMIYSSVLSAKFKCDDCSKCFESHKSLQNYHRIEHELKGDIAKFGKYLTCVFCGIIFVTIYSLKNHMQRCRAFSNQLCVCKNCGKFF